MEVTTDAVQVLGGYGYVEDFPAERLMREAKGLQIVEGTNQIERMVIGRAPSRPAWALRWPRSGARGGGAPGSPRRGGAPGMGLPAARSRSRRPVAGGGLAPAAGSCC